MPVPVAVLPVDRRQHRADPQPVPGEPPVRPVGCPADDRREAVEFPRDKTLCDRLANMEHRRWNADRYLSGWRYAKKRNDQLKYHDNLVPWDKLPDDIKKYDVENIEDIPEVLKSQNMKICQSE